MKKMCAYFLAFALCSVAHAGFNGLTHHSRADCANNESISWDWTANHELRVVSLHTPKNGDPVGEHCIVAEWQNTWRLAAVHWGEGHGGWIVRGYHWMKDRKGKPYIAAEERVTNCSIYDGWWDRTK